MRSHIGGVIDLVRIAHVGDEADAFRIGDGVGERLGKGRIGREFQNARLPELER